MSTEQTVRLGRVRPNDISVDPVVQRSLNALRAQKMADEYDPTAVGVITVSDRDGSRYVVDGQHRVEAAKLAGHGGTSVDAKIYTGLTRVEEARLFIALNSARIPSAVARFKVRREALDPVPVAICGILERYGWEVGNPGSSGKASAVKALEGVWALDPDQERKVFETTIDLITDTWGHDPNAMSASILSGVGEFVDRYAGQLDLVALAKKLVGVYASPVVLVAQGKSLKATRGGRVSTCIGEIVHAVYNAKRTTGRLDRW
jgi:hypothetical protein